MARPRLDWGLTTWSFERTRTHCEQKQWAAEQTRAGKEFKLPFLGGGGGSGLDPLGDVGVLSLHASEGQEEGTKA